MSLADTVTKLAGYKNFMLDKFRSIMVQADFYISKIQPTMVAIYYHKISIMYGISLNTITNRERHTKIEAVIGQSHNY